MLSVFFSLSLSLQIWTFFFPFLWGVVYDSINSVLTRVPVGGCKYILAWFIEFFCFLSPLVMFLPIFSLKGRAIVFCLVLLCVLKKENMGTHARASDVKP